MGKTSPTARLLTHACSSSAPVVVQTNPLPGIDGKMLTHNQCAYLNFSQEAAHNQDI